MHFFDMYKTYVIRKRHFDDFADFALGKSIFFIISQLSTFRFFDLAINNRLDVEKNNHDHHCDKFICDQF